METDKKIATMEEELKLIKGELKQSLAGVRDYLLNMELPSSEFASVLAALGDGGGQKVTMKGSFTTDKPPDSSEPPQEEKEEPVLEETREEEEEPVLEETREEIPEPESELPPEEEILMSPDESLEDEPEQSPEDQLESPEDQLMNQDENLEPEDGLLSEAEPDEPEEPLMPESELPIEEEPQMVQGKINAEVSQSTPKVNLLANLMHWITKTKKEIGNEQLPIFLEVYGISGHLSPELKELILHMADIVSEQPDDGNTAEIWSRAMLSLHGILTGGDAPLHPVKAFWYDEDSEIPPSEDEVNEVETDKPKDMPLKLKLVLPNGDGKSQEFCLDLKPEVADNGAQEAPDSQECPNERGDVLWQRQPRKKR